MADADASWVGMNKYSGNADRRLARLIVYRATKRMMSMKKIYAAAICGIASLMPVSAGATVWDFQVTGNGTASFSIDSDKMQPWSVNNTGITYKDVVGIYNGVSDKRYVQFFNDGGYGGFNISYVGQGKGAVLFSGPPTAPVFTTGTFFLPPLAYGAPGGFTLTITDVTAAVPEPATWAMMMLGFGIVGYGVRRRKANVRTAVRFA